jgi:hypothetical protein
MSIEIRFDADDADDIAVLDAYCQAHNSNRKVLLSALLHEWVERQVHASMMVLRVKRINPLEVDSHRTGSAPPPWRTP